MNDDYSIEIWTVDRKVDERTLLSVRRFRGLWFLDLRVQFLNVGGKWQPTAKGVSIKASHLAGFVVAVKRALDVIRARVPDAGDPRIGGAE